MKIKETRNFTGKFVCLYLFIKPNCFMLIILFKLQMNFKIHVKYYLKIYWSISFDHKYKFHKQTDDKLKT